MSNRQLASNKILQNNNKIYAKLKLCQRYDIVVVGLYITVKHATCRSGQPPLSVRTRLVRPSCI